MDRAIPRCGSLYPWPLTSLLFEAGEGLCAGTYVQRGRRWEGGEDSVGAPLYAIYTEARASEISNEVGQNVNDASCE